MTKRTYTQKDGTEWDWEETPELAQLLQQLQKDVAEKRFGGNYSGPLYAPHPDIENE